MKKEGKWCIKKSLKNKFDPTLACQNHIFDVSKKGLNNFDPSPRGDWNCVVNSLMLPFSCSYSNVLTPFFQEVPQYT